ncbi:heavy metal translocating P-type ATPase [Actinophytocola oryzae]|uniref:heavy metal translocating P-type ATPase n=1 Tax=Actinophytocola oryzae TaxID=502181 RepID=UPI00312CB1F9
MDGRVSWRPWVVVVAVLAAATLAGAALPWVWVAVTVAGLVFSLSMVVSDLRARRFGTDVLATASLVGTLLVGEHLAGALIALMLGTGQALECYARGRAHRDLDALLARAPRTARVRRGGAVLAVPLAEVAVGDVVVVRSGEVVPVDGRLLEPGVFDESALTGEPLPVAREADTVVRSGVCNAGAVVAVCAVRTAEGSAYAGVVRLAEQALAGAAPVARIADRFAVVLVPVALAVAGFGWWWTGEPARAVAVLVTATPCPLLLAVPVAIAGGMSAVSRRGVVVKDGAVLERLGRVRTAILDKTGTVTVGAPVVTEVLTAPGKETGRVLGLAAAVERESPHVLATAVVTAARRARVPVGTATAVRDVPGAGAEGVVDGLDVAVGRAATTDLPGWARSAVRRARLDAAGVVWVRVAGEPVAALLVRDELRPEAGRTLGRLRAAGVDRLVLVTGDRREVAEDVGRLLGLDDVVADASPREKVARVLAEQEHAPTMAVGDGVNDAPALAAADVGVAVAARGLTATAQVADAVLTDEGIDRLADAVESARRARGIAVQSAALGVGLSLVAMLAAVSGFLAPAAGALVQELIDVLAVGNALRALRGNGAAEVPLVARRLITRFRAEHADLADARSAVRGAADALSGGLTPLARARVRAAHQALVDRILPHERAEEQELYPAVAPMVGGRAGIAPMSRGHAEIERLAGRLGRHLAAEPTADQVDDLRATLYGLDAVLTLHFAQEEQDYFVLADREH